jgi:hypothetical protein
MAAQDSSDDNPLLTLFGVRSAALTTLGYAPGAPPPPLAVLYTALQIAPLRRLYAWAVPTPEALDAVTAVSPRGVVDVGAGTGYWAHLLRRRGVDTLAYDAVPVDDAAAHNGHHTLPGSGAAAPPFARVLRAGAADAARAHPERTLLLCWPPPEGEDAGPQAGRTMALDALAAYAGSTLIYVGEDDGAADAAALSATTHAPGAGRRGATAGPAFHGALAAGWALQSRVELPRWPSVRPPAADVYVLTMLRACLTRASPRCRRTTA